MRVLSIVLIFAMLAIFGANGETLKKCQVACKSPPDTQDRVCLLINGRNHTMDPCAYNNLKNCLSTKIKNTGITVDLVQNSACDIDTKTACYNMSCKGKTLYPICVKFRDNMYRYGNLCKFLVDLNCDDLEKGRNSANQILNFGECGPN